MSNNKWVKLADMKKELPAEEPMVIWVKDDDPEAEGYWTKGFLSRIEFKGGKKHYVFEAGDNEIDNATHVMLIDKPKDQ